MKTHPRLPKDLIPYWDMDAPNIPNEPRDASSASCIASALYEISTMDVPDANSYKNYADSIMASLASPNYLASLGKMVTFINAFSGQYSSWHRNRCTFKLCRLLFPGSIETKA